MGAFVERKGPQGSPRMATETFPSEHAPKNYFEREAARQRSAGRNVPAEDRENGEGNCCNCGAHLLASEKTCWNCESDNPQGRRLNRAG